MHVRGTKSVDMYIDDKEINRIAKEKLLTIMFGENGAGYYSTQVNCLFIEKISGRLCFKGNGRVQIVKEQATDIDKAVITILEAIRNEHI